MNGTNYRETNWGEALDTEKVSRSDFAEPEPRFEAGFFRWVVPLSAAESYAE
jgi:hypothetical protein